MRLWQQGMIFLARNKAVKNFMQNRATMSELARRFVGGKDALEATEKSRALQSQGRKSSLFYLGEYVEDLSVINQTVSELKAIIKSLGSSNLDIHISVDPTQIGYQIDEIICHANAFEIAGEIRKAIKPNNNTRNFLMLDMEDSTVTEATIKLYNSLIGASLPTALTLQAYLLRTENDLQKIVNSGGAVRLVKGAFAERKSIAISERSAIDREYMRLAAIMLSDEARKSGFYPIFATHDDKLINEIIDHASKHGWDKQEYEFEFLYGVRDELQNTLVQNGCQLRLYLPFGTDWWPYAVRRVGESPKNARFLLRSVTGN
jgi:proline dehydrogenase